jgi:pre-rRNA-processing protein TSR2
MRESAQFQAAVVRLFQHWDVLHHAVESQFGGHRSREKAEWIPSVVIDFFSKNKDLEPSEIETFVGEIMDNEFDLLVEDGSLKKLSRQLCRCFALARDDRFEELKDFLNALQPLPPPRSKAVDKDDSDDEEGDEKEGGKVDGDQEPTEIVENTEEKNEEAKKERKERSAPVVDEEGFTLVVGKKKHR